MEIRTKGTDTGSESQSLIVTPGQQTQTAGFPFFRVDREEPREAFEQSSHIMELAIFTPTLLTPTLSE